MPYADMRRRQAPRADGMSECHADHRTKAGGGLHTLGDLSGVWRNPVFPVFSLSHVTVTVLVTLFPLLGLRPGLRGADFNTDSRTTHTNRYTNIEVPLKNR